MKKKKAKAKVSNKNIAPDLPQNIVSVGERVFEDKNIYIHQKVYAQIHKFADSKTENEHGGILVGRVLNELGKENTIIEGFIEAKYDSATHNTLTFTHETWDYFHSQIDKKYEDKKIVGWIHTHPNFGIFLSENDRFIQQNFFSDSNQVAYVIDPIQNEEGFFFWINEKLERCPGFYLFDKNGVRIKQRMYTKDSTEPGTIKKSFGGYILPIIMMIVIAANAVFLANQSVKINRLEQELNYMKQVINNQGALLQKLLPLQELIKQEDNQNDNGVPVNEENADSIDNEEKSST